MEPLQNVLIFADVWVVQLSRRQAAKLQGFYSLRQEEEEEEMCLCCTSFYFHSVTRPLHSPLRHLSFCVYCADKWLSQSTPSFDDTSTQTSVHCSHTDLEEASDCERSRCFWIRLLDEVFVVWTGWSDQTIRRLLAIRMRFCHGGAWSWEMQAPMPPRTSRSFSEMFLRGFGHLQVLRYFILHNESRSWLCESLSESPQRYRGQTTSRGWIFIFFFSEAVLLVRLHQLSTQCSDAVVLGSGHGLEFFVMLFQTWMCPDSQTKADVFLRLYLMVVLTNWLMVNIPHVNLIYRSELNSFTHECMFDCVCSGVLVSTVLHACMCYRIGWTEISTCGN